MRLQVISTLSTKDGEANKNSRLTNMLAEKSGERKFATIRPALERRGTNAGSGNGLVSFNDTLLSVYDTFLNLSVPTANDTDPGQGIEDIDDLTVTHATSVATGVNSNGGMVVGYTTYAGGARKAFYWTRLSGMVEFTTLKTSSTPRLWVSDNGDTILGYGLVTTGNAFTYTVAGGLVNLGFAPGTIRFANSTCTAFCGSTTGNHAFVWTQAGGLNDIGTNGGTSSVAFCCSSDGSVVVGSYNSPGQLPFRYASGVFTALGNLGGSGQGFAYGCSSDGSVVFGLSRVASTKFHPFKWTGGGGIVDLTPSDSTRSFFETESSPGISSNGTVFVFVSSVGGVYESWRYSTTTGLMKIGDLGGNYMYAQCHSSDCSLIAGEGYDSGAIGIGWTWKSSYGSEDMGYITPASADIEDPNACSSDGTVVVGFSNTADTAFRWKREAERFRSVATLSDSFFDFAQSTL